MTWKFRVNEFDYGKRAVSSNSGNIKITNGFLVPTDTASLFEEIFISYLEVISVIEGDGKDQTQLHSIELLL